MDQVFRAPTDYEFEHEISNSAAIKHQRQSSKDGDEDCDDLGDDGDDGLMGEIGEDGEEGDDLVDSPEERGKNS